MLLFIAFGDLYFLRREEHLRKGNNNTKVKMIMYMCIAVILRSEGRD